MPKLFYLGDNNSALILGKQVLGTVYSGTNGRYQYYSDDCTIFALFDDMPLVSELIALHSH